MFCRGLKRYFEKRDEEFRELVEETREFNREIYGQTLGLEHSVDYGKIPGGEFETGNLTLQVVDAAAIGREFEPRASPSWPTRSTAASATRRSSATPTATP